MACGRARLILMWFEFVGVSLVYFSVLGVFMICVCLAFEFVFMLIFCWWVLIRIAFWFVTLPVGCL